MQWNVQALEPLRPTTRRVEGIDNSDPETCSHLQSLIGRAWVIRRMTIGCRLPRAAGGGSGIQTLDLPGVTDAYHNWPPLTRKKILRTSIALKQCKISTRRKMPDLSNSVRLGRYYTLEASVQREI